MSADEGTKKLLGLNQCEFTALFDSLDLDKDGLLNAAELRGLFEYLFGESVSNEHLFHFENRYLLNYGESGCLSRANFLAILEDYENAFDYSLDDDIGEFYLQVDIEGQPNIHVDVLYNEIQAMLPPELVPKLINFKERVASTIKSRGSGALVSAEGFNKTVRKCFIPTGQQKMLLADSPVEEAPSSVKNPFYRDMLASKVTRYERGMTPKAIRSLLKCLNSAFKPQFDGRKSCAVKERSERQKQK